MSSIVLKSTFVLLELIREQYNREEQILEPARGRIVAPGLPPVALLEPRVIVSETAIILTVINVETIVVAAIVAT